MSKFPLDEVRDAWRAGEISASEIARRTGKAPNTVSRTLNGEIDPPESAVREYFTALQEFRAEANASRASEQPAVEQVTV